MLPRGGTARTTAAAGPVPAAHAGTRPDAVQQNLNALVGPGKYPGALAAVGDRHGRTRHYTAGAGDVRTGAKVPADGRVRIGGASKTFTAVVVLQHGPRRDTLDLPRSALEPADQRGLAAPTPRGAGHFDHAARTAAMFQLAVELPAGLLARCLGIDISSAVDWQRAASGDWHPYAARIASNEHHRT